MTTLRPIAFALAATALTSAHPAAAWEDGFPVDHRPAHAVPASPPRAVTVTFALPPPAVAVRYALPPPPAWLRVVPPPPVVAWTPRDVALHYRWLAGTRAAFYGRWGVSPWRTARYEAWERAYRAGLERHRTLASVGIRGGYGGHAEERWESPGRGRGHGEGRGGHGYRDGRD
jgi:hypothetical protein